MATDFNGGPVEGGTYPRSSGTTSWRRRSRSWPPKRPAKKSARRHDHDRHDGVHADAVGSVVRVDLGDHDAQRDDPGRRRRRRHGTGNGTGATGTGNGGAGGTTGGGGGPTAAAAARPVAAAEPRRGGGGTTGGGGGGGTGRRGRWHRRRLRWSAEPAAPGSAAAAAQRSRRCRPAHRPRQEAAARRAEAPRQLGGLRDPDPRVDDDLDVAPGPRPRRDHDRPDREVAAVVLELDVQRLGELARPRAEVSRGARRPRRSRISSIPSSGSSARISTAAPTPRARRRRSAARGSRRSGTRTPGPAGRTGSLCAA